MAAQPGADPNDEVLRERGSTATHFDPAEMAHGRRPAADAAAGSGPGVLLALVPLGAVVVVNMLAGLWVLASSGLSLSDLRRRAETPGL